MGDSLRCDLNSNTLSGAGNHQILVNSISTYESSTRVKVLGGNNLHFKSKNYFHPSQINTQVKVLGANNLHFKYKIYFHPGVSDGDVK